MTEISKQESEKKTAGERAAEFVKDGMIIGLGTGSTVFYAINKLGEMVRDGLKIKAVSSSHTTTKLAESLNIGLLSINDTKIIDLTIDGADEVDKNLDGIKGGGGALLFEKIVALSSKKNIWIVDSAKIVEKLGKFSLPVEVIPFALNFVSDKLTKDGYSFNIRKKEGELYQTDSGNYIFDLHLREISKPSELDKELKLISGIVETGIFSGIADTLIIGKDGSTEIITRKI